MERTIIRPDKEWYKRREARLASKVYSERNDNADFLRFEYGECSEPVIVRGYDNNKRVFGTREGRGPRSSKE